MEGRTPIPSIFVILACMLIVVTLGISLLLLSGPPYPMSRKSSPNEYFTIYWVYPTIDPGGDFSVSVDSTNALGYATYRIEGIGIASSTQIGLYPNELKSITVTASSDSVYGGVPLTWTVKQSPFYDTVSFGVTILRSEGERYTLSVSVSPSGSGTVTPSSGVYDSGTSVTLLATPSPTYEFSYWTGLGAANVFTNPATVTMDSTRLVTAYFSGDSPPDPPDSPDPPDPSIYYQLSVSVSPQGSGSVSPSSGEYISGSTVSLVATPNSGYKFERWSGDVGAMGTIYPHPSSITLTMDRDRTVSAIFIAEDEPPSDNVWLSGFVTDEENISLAGVKISCYLLSGELVTETETNSDGYYSCELLKNTSYELVFEKNGLNTFKGTIQTGTTDKQIGTIILTKGYTSTTVVIAIAAGVCIFLLILVLLVFVSRRRSRI